MSQNNLNRAPAYLAGLGYATIFGFSFLVTKGALEAYRPLELLFLRFALATLILGLLALLRIIKIDYRGKKARSLLLACLFQPILYFTAETFGVRDSATSTAGIVLGALPATVAALGMLMLKERLGKAQVASLGLSVLGVALIAAFGGAGRAGEGTAHGFLLLVGALASATFYNVYSRRASRDFSPIETTFAMMLAGCLAFGLAALAEGLLLPPSAGILERSSPSAIGAILYLGALSSILAFFFINFSLSRLRATESAAFSNLITVITVTVGVLLRGEPFGLVEAAGVAMIVLGVWGTNALRPKAARP